MGICPIVLTATRFLAPTVFLALVASAPLHAATITVNTTTDELNNDGDCSLREALRAAALNAAVDNCAQGAGASDTIMVPAGTFTLTLTGDEGAGAAGDLNITAAMTIQGVSAASTIIDGNGTDRVFEIQSNVTLRNLTVQHGNPTYHGNSFDSFGGGIREVGGSLTLDGCVVKDNTGLSGGGLYVSAGPTLTIVDSEISGNVATGAGTSNGAGLSVDGTPTTITGTTIAGNMATAVHSRGGGLYLHSSTTDFTTTITASTISGNSAEIGAGIATENHSTLALRNVTISGNTSNGFGNGLLQTFGVAVTVQNSTIVDNIGPGTGLQDGGNGPAITVQNSIIANNGSSLGDPADCGGNVISAGYNLVEAPGLCSFTQPGDQTGVDPALSALALHGGATKTHEPAALSPAIDRGNPAAPGSGGGACESTDQNGVTRPIAGVCDVGAMETVNAGIPTTTTTSTTLTTTTTVGDSTTTTTSVTGSTTSSTLPSTCATLSNVTVRVKKYAAPAGNEKLIVKATLPVASGVPASLDPATTGLQVRLHDLGAGTPLLDLTGDTPVPSGVRGSGGCGSKDGWKKLAYQNQSGAIAPPLCPSGSAAGVRTVTLGDKRKKSKGITFSLVAPKASLAPPVGPLSVAIVLGGDAAVVEGACGTFSFAPGTCKPSGKSWVCK